VRSAVRILFVAHSFPPSTEVGGARVVGLCKYMPEFGISPVVLTVQDRFHGRLDRTISIPSATRVIRTPQNLTPLDWYAAWRSRRPPANSVGTDGRPSVRAVNASSDRTWRQQLLSLMLVPDKYWGWYRPAVRTGRHLLQSGKFDAIISTGPPFTAHLIARSLRAKFRIPWIADFRDPWVGNDALQPFHTSWRAAMDARLESKCIRQADMVVCNNRYVNESFRKRYPELPEKKFATLTNGYDNVLPPADLSLSKHTPLKCLHLGAIYAGRRIDGFCGGLLNLVREGKLDPHRLKVLFLGEMDDAQLADCRRVASDLIASGTIEFQPPIDRERARGFLWEADVLLVFQGGHRTQIPAKFYEYLVTGKPMFAVAEQGALTELIEMTGSGAWAGPDDARAIEEKFLSALALPAKPPDEVQRQWAPRFHYRSLSNQLSTWIRELVEKRKEDR
jgi:hypothetical protein